MATMMAQSIVDSMEMMGQLMGSAIAGFASGFAKMFEHIGEKLSQQLFGQQQQSSPLQMLQVVLYALANWDKIGKGAKELFKALREELSLEKREGGEGEQPGEGG